MRHLQVKPHEFLVKIQNNFTEMVHMLISIKIARNGLAWLNNMATRAKNRSISLVTG